MWLAGLLLLRVGVLSKLPPLLVGMILVLAASVVVLAAGFSAVEEAKRAKEHRATGGEPQQSRRTSLEMVSLRDIDLRRTDDQIETTDASAGTGGDTSLPEGWRHDVDTASGFGYLSYTDGYSIWEEEALMLAKYVAVHADGPVDASPRPSDASPIAHRPRPTSSASTTSFRPFELRDIFGTDELQDGDMEEAQAHSGESSSSNMNPLHATTRNAAQAAATKRASAKTSTAATNSTARAVRFGSVRLASVPRGIQKAAEGDGVSAEEQNEGLSTPGVAQGVNESDATAAEPTVGT